MTTTTPTTDQQLDAMRRWLCESVPGVRERDDEQRAIMAMPASDVRAWIDRHYEGGVATFEQDRDPRRLDDVTGQQPDGPYTVTTSIPCENCEGGGEVWGEDQDGQPDEPGLRSTCGRCDGTGARVVSRVAFATLDEALVAVRREGFRFGSAQDVTLRKRGDQPAFDAEGGSITLPDGTLIEVELVGMVGLARRLPPPPFSKRPADGWTAETLCEYANECFAAQERSS